MSNRATKDRLTKAQMRAWRAFLEAHAHVTDTLDTELEEAQGLPLTWYDVLVQLSEAPGRALRMQELAGRVLLSKSNCTRLVDRMEAAGLVAREHCASDRRGTFAVLTEGGWERLQRAAPVHLRGIQAHFVRYLSEAEARTLALVLERITAPDRQ